MLLEVGLGVVSPIARLAVMTGVIDIAKPEACVNLLCQAYCADSVFLSHLDLQ